MSDREQRVVVIGAGIVGAIAAPGLRRRLGHRPSIPDILHGFGHGHTGLSMAPVSARILADMVSGLPQAFDATPFAPQRFRRWTI